ncbi:hypothetical protein amb1425 [Paramagnetospirillum magneticum AMB-1]|uniref:Uncharacterized protein n=1 Tax=Paramagnetospirillum magneticum (strain ATCC 700264 / AMB-1) TaxID=342108 RepID=Q2W7E5_PARM1|nr:hypothetical protein amb1425 [Paramagnetospirillum magneticum AMB-1]
MARTRTPPPPELIGPGAKRPCSASLVLAASVLSVCSVVIALQPNPRSRPGEPLNPSSRTLADKHGLV